MAVWKSEQTIAIFVQSLLPSLFWLGLVEADRLALVVFVFSIAFLNRFFAELVSSTRGSGGGGGRGGILAAAVWRWLVKSRRQSGCHKRDNCWRTFGMAAWGDNKISNNSKWLYFTNKPASIYQEKQRTIPIQDASDSGLTV